jgi:hypothetical protein
VRTSIRRTYRTLLGHFRHEVGHFWDRLVRCGGLGLPHAVGDERGTTAKPSTANTHRVRHRTGGRVTSAPTRPCILGRVSPRPGLTTYT